MQADDYQNSRLPKESASLGVPSINAEWRERKTKRHYVLQE